MKSFFGELWEEYREIAKSLVGVVFELVVVLAVVKFGSWLVHLTNPPSPSSCTDPNASWIDCTHTAIVLFAWVGLSVSFVVVAAVFTYRHTLRRIRDVELSETVREAKDYSSGVAVAITSLDEGAGDSDRLRAIQILLDLRSRFPLDRKISIFLGRLYKARQDYESAISTASFFISSKEKAKQIADMDYADVLYNRACYRSLLSRKLGAGEPAEMAKREALEDLKASIAISPNNARDAAADSDFEPLRDNEVYRHLVAR